MSRGLWTTGGSHRGRVSEALCKNQRNLRHCNRSHPRLEPNPRPGNDLGRPQTHDGVVNGRCVMEGGGGETVLLTAWEKRGGGGWEVEGKV